MQQDIRGFTSIPMVSVIIPTFNSEETLACCLQSIKDQTYPNVETIVVDRYSRDGTLKVAEKFDARVLLMDSERSAAKNCGVAKAKGSFILFLDSDMELTHRVVEECVVACLKKGADAVNIPEVSVAHDFLGECRKIEKELYSGNISFEVPRFFKKEVFLAIEGLDEGLIYGEDADLYARIERAGYRTERIRAEMRHYEGDLSLGKIMLKAYYYGKSFPCFVAKDPSLAMKWLSPIRWVYMRNLKLLLKHPIHFVGLVFTKLVKYVAHFIGILAYLLSV